ncbi:hypothetical protein [Microcoleus sp. POL10_C6]|uniref:hypothetical protein n=1 Tax=unclassified Microcoleus TaxID=2642155 RepID=UPI002FD64A63
MPSKHELKDRTHTLDKSLVENAIAVLLLVRSSRSHSDIITNLIFVTESFPTRR